MEVLEKIPFKDKPQCGYLIKKSKRGYELFIYNLVSEAWMNGFSNLDDCHLWIECLEEKKRFLVERLKGALYAIEPEEGNDLNLSHPHSIRKEYEQTFDIIEGKSLQK